MLREAARQRSWFREATTLAAQRQVTRLYETLLKAGAISYLCELPDAEHGFDLYKAGWSPAAQAETSVTERFLASLV